MADLEVFIEALKNDEDGSILGRPLALIPPGSWDQLVEWAETQGFHFTLADLERYLQDHPNIPRQWSGHPILHPWSLSTLKTAIRECQR